MNFIYKELLNILCCFLRLLFIKLFVKMTGDTPMIAQTKKPKFFPW